MAIHEVEDVFVAYCEDTVERVLNDYLTFKNQDISPRRYLTKKKSVKNFKIKKTYAISINLLKNDV